MDRDILEPVLLGVMFVLILWYIYTSQPRTVRSQATALGKNWDDNEPYEPQIIGVQWTVLGETCNNEMAWDFMSPEEAFGIYIKWYTGHNQSGDPVPVFIDPRRNIEILPDYNEETYLYEGWRPNE